MSEKGDIKQEVNNEFQVKQKLMIVKEIEDHAIMVFLHIFTVDMK